MHFLISLRLTYPVYVIVSQIPWRSLTSVSVNRYTFSKVKVKVPHNRPEGIEGGSGIALLFLDLGARRGGWSAPRPGRFTPGKDPVPIVKEVGWAPGRAGRMRKISPPPGFDPRTVQTVASPYTD
jgi:hypothetical protein